MKKLKYIFLISAVIISCFTLGCQFQTVTKKFGGTTTVEIQKGQKLVPYTVQWEKDSTLWYLTEPMEDGYTPRTYTFHETSNLGVLEGQIVFVESK
jgi:hypothetical protein